MMFKVIFYPAVFIASYLLLVVADLSVPVQFLLWIILGFFTAFIGLNISHDAVHGSLSANKTVNKILGYTFNVIGANSYVWNITHNIVHHTYTNIDGHDEDIQLLSLLRMSPNQKLRKVHRHQYWYAFFFYSLASLMWVFIKDYIKFFKKEIGNYDNKTHPAVEYVILFLSKSYLLYALYRYSFCFYQSFMVADFGWFYCYAPRSGINDGYRFYAGACSRRNRFPAAKSHRNYGKYLGGSPVIYDCRFWPQQQSIKFSLWWSQLPDRTSFNIQSLPCAL